MRTRTTNLIVGVIDAVVAIFYLALLVYQVTTENGSPGWAAFNTVMVIVFAFLALQRFEEADQS